MARNDLLPRPRINTLLARATKKPVTIVCAGMGCGKTRAVYDFTQECQIPVAWLQITEADNIRARLWDMFVRGIGKINKQLASEYRKLGFPDTEDKLNMYLILQRKMGRRVPCIFVLDDFHLLKDPAALEFIERGINNLLENSAVVIISREMPRINTSCLMLRDKVSLLSEAELNFTESEINDFLIYKRLSEEIDNLKEIYEDTKGWAILVNFVMRMLEQSPGYMGYVRDAITKDITQLIEMELWARISEPLKNLLLKLSLINHYVYKSGL